MHRNTVTARFKGIVFACLANNNLDIDRLKNIIQKEPAPEWENKDVVLCEPSGVSGAKKMKIIKLFLPS